jgi:hypothetical protein
MINGLMDFTRERLERGEVVDGATEISR